MRAVATQLAWHYLGIPYQWGGDDQPVGGYPGGFDCSGFNIELLQCVGQLPEGFDTTADGLRKMYSDREVLRPYEGCFVFYGRNGYASHVEYCINELLCIGASGGSSHTKTLNDAINQDACVKLHPINRRKDIIGYVDPFLPKPVTV